jgi:hypothetical protein
VLITVIDFSTFVVSSFSSLKRKLMPVIKKTDEESSGCNISDKDNKWAPHICCSLCAVTQGLV